LGGGKERREKEKGRGGEEWRREEGVGGPEGAGRRGKPAILKIF